MTITNSKAGRCHFCRLGLPPGSQVDLAKNDKGVPALAFKKQGYGLVLAHCDTASQLIQQLEFVGEQSLADELKTKLQQASKL